MTNYHFDMETADPDDVFTLALMATHPKSNLVGVTVHPGGKDQVSLVKHVLNILGKNHVPVGAGTPKKEASRVSSFYHGWLGKIDEYEEDGTAVEIIQNSVRSQHPHLITGAALTNIASAAVQNKAFTPFFDQWTCQGGFAGDNVVPPQYVLEKFKGKNECETFNLNGDVNAALMLLRTDMRKIDHILMVSKNVCHGMIWTPEVHDRVPDGKHAGLDLLKSGMAHYFKKHSEGKALHDTIAAAVAIDSSIAEFEAVEIYRSNGKWGSRKYNDLIMMHTMDASPPILITVHVDEAMFEKVIVG